MTIYADDVSVATTGPKTTEFELEVQPYLSFQYNWL